MRLLLPLLLATLLAACGDEQTATIPASWSTSNTLVYAYPYNGQSQIAPTAPVVLRFAAPLTDKDNPAALATHFSITGAGNPSFTLQVVDGGRGVMLQPSKLSEKADYLVSWSDLATADGLVKPVSIGFSTRPANKGARSQINSNSNPALFTVTRALPVQENFPLMDFSSLRLQFSAPINSKTLKYGLGQSVSLEDSAGALVPATVLGSGRLLTIDPKNDLVPGQTYTLKLQNTLKSTLGDALDPGTYAAFSFIPKNSAPRSTMVMEVPASGITSPLTGGIINNVPIVSDLLGRNGASQQQGNLYTELAFVPRYPHATPMRVARGNMMSGTAVDVQIAGQVPAGLNTGNIKVTVISDANGYMTDNPYSTALDAPRLVYLTMDTAMSADTPAANGAFNQNIQHIEVVGTAIVKNNRLVMDGVGVVELDVLGVDMATGVLSFHLEGYADQTTAPAPVADTTSPELQSWLPGDDNTARARPGDPVILTFTEPVDPTTVNASSLLFLKDSVAEPFDWRVDGSSIVIQPQSPLAHNADYTVQFTADIKDLAGNPAPATSKALRLPDLASPASRSPMLLASYPGYPCATTGRDAAAGLQGRCSGGKAGDDALPIPVMPTDRSIQLQFSQNLSASSVALGSSCGTGSFRVELVNSSGVCQSVVPGQLELSAQSLRFTPDTSWTEGQLYRYVLGSNGNSRSATATCDGTQSICGSNGLPLQTQALSQTVATSPTATGGGPAMEIWFQGGAHVSTVAQRLRGLPASDVNANFIHDAGEFGPVDTGSGVPDAQRYVASNASRIITSGQSGLVTGSNIGCAVGSTCPTQQFLYLSNALDSEVAEYDASAGGVRVLIQPTQLIASSVNVYANTTFGNTVTATGPQVMRLRYAVNPANGKRELPITGYIKDVGGVPTLSGTMDLYLDEPAMDPVLNGVSINHDLRSFPLTVSVSGPVSFLPDGRMLATLSNDADVNFAVALSPLSIYPSGTINLRIPARTMKMEGVSAPIKQ